MHWYPIKISSSKLLFINKKNQNINILIYGKYFENILLPEFENTKCDMSHHFNVFRSNRIVEFDVVILHFEEYKKFVHKYINSNPKEKKLMIIFLMTLLMKKYFYFWILSYYKKSKLSASYGDYSKSFNPYIDVNELKIQFLGRTNSSLAIISNCDVAHSIRIEYINRLKKYFPIDTYGKCFKNFVVPRDNGTLLSKYKLYLSFENSICEDYITEKYYIPLIQGAIPVVMSPTFNLKNLIPQSYINVFDFPNPKTLARYLHSVSSNFTEYLKYFQWKRNYRINSAEISYKICDILQKIYQSLNTYVTNDFTAFQVSNKLYCMDISDQKNILIQN
ncbi:hypothetical protein MXB_3429 [Myxobolus squamalis]|nr:hypothetical protein MXB_3429 [Myxobolus squamalis]